MVLASPRTWCSGYGHVVRGNSLSNTRDLIYETGRVQVWGNTIRKVGRVPLPEL